MDIKQTETFSKWLASLRDLTARSAILVRMDRAKLGNLGNVRAVGKGVSEMKVDVGAGYRVYFTLRGQTVVILLCGGNKKTQQRDIETAQAMARDL